MRGGLIGVVVDYDACCGDFAAARVYFEACEGVDDVSPICMRDGGGC
jgi:hypothetical protein